MDKNHEEQLKKGRLLTKHLDEYQYSYFDGRPEWITIHESDLKLFLACLYYDYPCPSNAINENDYVSFYNAKDIFELYEKKIKKKILKMIEIVKNKFITPFINNIEVGVTITHSICKSKCDTCQNFPNKDIHKWTILRLKSIDNKFIFIDFQHDRTYIGWKDYLQNNNLPEGFMFYPESGFYDGSKSLYQTITPASQNIEKILKNADIGAHISNWVGGVMVAWGFIFPIFTPIVLVTSVAATVSSAYATYRQFDKLVDIYRHANNKSGVLMNWINLAISAIGAITAPFHALAAITSEVNSTIQSSTKALTIFRRSVCITQCTLEVFRATLEFIDNNFKLTLENVLKLRLDLFIVTGIIMSPSYIEHIFKVLSMQAVWLPIYKTMETIPYCLGKTVWNSVYFFKNHFAVFVERVTMFLSEILSPSNLLFAWKNIRSVFEAYQKQTAELDVDKLLWHVVDLLAKPESVKYVLRGQKMLNLLESLRECAPKKPIRLALVKYCVDRVLREAKKLCVLYNESAAEVARRGETRAWELDKEFCQMFSLESCSMDQYVLWAIGEIGKNAAALMAEYEKHASRPENLFDDEMVVNQSDGAGQSVKAYTLVAPCGVLDLEICLRLGQKINPQPHRYLDHELVQPEPGVSLMFRVSAFNIDMVFFGVDLINGVPKMNVCFFQKNRESAKLVGDVKGLRKLQAA